jgi:hypothetical protein
MSGLALWLDSRRAGPLHSPRTQVKAERGEQFVLEADPSTLPESPAMRSVVSLMITQMLFVACLVPSADAWPQSSADRGQWQIVEARYGSAQQSIDVTQRLRELVRNDNSFRVSNDLFGRDPHPNVVKTLRITARGQGGFTRTFEYAESQFVQGTLFNAGVPAGSGQASVGGQGNHQPGDGGAGNILEARYGSAQQGMDVTQRVRDLARSDAQFRVSNDLFGRDPHPNVVKSLRIKVRGPNGQTRTFEYAENQYASRSQFTGWNSGNWGGGGGSRDSGADSGW